MVSRSCISFLGYHNKSTMDEWLNTERGILSQFLRLEVWNQPAGPHALLKVLRENSSLPLSSLGASGNPCCSLAYSYISPISASVFTGHSFLYISSASVYSHLLLPALIKTPVIRFRACGNPPWPHFNLNTSAKILSPNKG